MKSIPNRAISFAIAIILFFSYNTSILKADLNEDLFKAVKAKDLSLVKSLIEKGADVKAKDEYGWIILHSTVVEGDFEIFKYLVSKGADINAKTSGNWTTLHYASDGGNFEIVKYLVSKGADVKAKNDDGFTVLHSAARGGNLEIVKYLVGKGANVNSKDNYYWTVLNSAHEGGNIEIFKYLVERGADINAKDNYGRTILIKVENKEIVKYLLSKGANRAELVNHKRTNWWYCDSYNTNCIYKMKLTFENKSYKPIKSITFMLTISDSNDNKLYKKKHTVALDLDNDEVGDTQEFKLNGNVNSSYSFDDSSNHSINVEVISVK
jgi:ankyrin repeat protein